VGTPGRLHRYSFEDYLALEQVSTVKHEFLEGEIYGMAGGSVLHAALSAAIVAALHVQLRGRCRVYSSDLRTRVLATGLASYADATVVCGAVETDPENVDTVTNPTLLVEVLSPATIDYDLGEKFEHYKRSPSVSAVLYVSQDHRRIELRERTVDDSWRAQVFEAGQAVTIEMPTCRIDVDAIYAEAGGP
jgi:Uma2 family endonuclease